MLLLLNREVKEVQQEALDCEERLQGWQEQLQAAERFFFVAVANINVIIDNNYKLAIRLCRHTIINLILLIMWG